MRLARPLLLALGLMLTPLAATAQVPAEAAPGETAAPAAAQGSAAAASADAAAPAPAAAAPAPAGDGSLPGYTPMKPTEGIGMPVPAATVFQEQFSPTGHYARWMYDTLLLPIITVISLVVLGLMIYVIVRFRRAANPTPSKTTHNTLVEVLWTGIPVLILLVIAVPSIDLLAQQYKPAPKDAVTIKATGYQWYWGYSYPDHGGFEIVSNMLPEKGAEQPGKRFRTDADGPRLLATDTRMVVPAGVPLRIQTTGSDVIHSFAVPSLWFKIDAVPGRLNEKALLIEKPGVYYGQCSELCGARHAFMPIVIEALPPAKFAAWVAANGGTMPGAKTNVSATPDAEPAEGVAPGATTDGSAAARAQSDAADSTPVSAPAAPAAK